MKSLRTLYPYTDESIEEINEKFVELQFDGIVLPVTVERGRESSFRILKQKKFDGSFTSPGIFLADFLRKTDLQDGQVFLSVVELFNALSREENIPGKEKNYEILRKAIKEIYSLTSHITVNNDLYYPNAVKEEYFSKLTKEFSDIDYAYTMFHRLDDITEYQSIVPVNMNMYDVITYMNLGKKVYLPQFESTMFAKQFTFEQLLAYYKPEKHARLGLSFNNDVDITVISKQNANKVLRKVIEKNRKRI